MRSASFVAVVAALALPLTGCAWDLLGTAPNRDPGLAVLPACPDKPCCVNSDQAGAPEQAAIAPLPAAGTADATFQALRAVLADEAGATILVDAPPYLHARVVTPWARFRDDVEFRYDSAAGVLHVRSESRIGHSDLGVNRDRVERIRVALQAALR